MGKTNQSIVIGVPPDTVWQAIRNFHDLNWAPNVVTKVEKVGEKPGDQVGSGRILNDLFHETLLETDENLHTFSYRIDDGPTPISKTEIENYVGTVKLEPIGDGRATRVEWSSHWDKNDEPVTEFCHSIYVAMLEDMKKSLE
jgi:hypothetical protein